MYVTQVWKNSNEWKESYPIVDDTALIEIMAKKRSKNWKDRKVNLSFVTLRGN